MRRFGACLAFGLALAGGSASAQAVVRAARLVPTTWRPTVQLAAHVDAQQDAALAAEQAGRITAIGFTSGQAVPAGAVLVQLDAGPQEAQLVLDEAKLGQAGKTAARTVKLMSIAGSSQANLEQAQADEAEAKAQVLFDEAQIAQLRVVAPFAGTMGIRKVDVGDYVQQGAQVAQIAQAAPLRVLFAVPQTEAGGLALGDGFSFSAPSEPGAPPAVAGQVIALSPLVQADTNARDAEGVLTQPAPGLLPGMFGVVTLANGAPQPAFSLPGAALNDSAIGQFVYVLDPAPGDSFVLRAVYVSVLGQAGDDAVVAAKGFSAGQRVLAIGGFNLSEGMKVTLQQ